MDDMSSVTFCKCEDKNMTYSEVTDYINEKNKLGSVFGLDGIKELLKKLGNPEKGIPAIHIAGTNGKGSVMAFVEETLIESGYNVGRYISPTIFDYRERWMHNKEWASEEEVAEAIAKVKDAVSEMEKDGIASPTSFEIETAAAFILFHAWNVDIMLIECGMGGRLDATNVIEENVINVLASISLDHMQFLGDTVEAIATDKLGIVRDGSILVSYPQLDKVTRVVRAYSREHANKLFSPDIKELRIIDESVYGSDFIYKGNKYRINMGGRYQIMNALTAIHVLEELESLDFGNNAVKPLSEEDIIRGLAKTEWPGRFQVLSKEPLIIVDGAHNEDAWMRLRESLDYYFTNKSFIYIIGVLADKDYLKMVDILSRDIEEVFTVQSDNPRALPAGDLARVFKEAGINAEETDGLSDALIKAKRKYRKDENVIIICGTLSITGDIIKCIKSMQ